MKNNFFKFHAITGPPKFCAPIPVIATPTQFRPCRQLGSCGRNLGRGPPTPHTCFEFQVNLSPGLANDCDVDNRVKKPLLHDMFDLLGLPVCNTGLSLFRMACRSAAGPRFGDGRPSALAAAATQKWKSKRKTAATGGDKGTAAAAAEPMAATTALQLQQRAAGKQRPQRSADLTCDSSPVWGNGRDWRRPVDTDGDWVRVFPFAGSAAESPPPPPRTAWCSRSGGTAIEGNGTARAAIKNIREYLRCCAKVARSCDGLSSVVADHELNDKLKDLFPAAATVWLPHD